MAVMSWVPLMSASPSFASRVMGGEPGLGQGRAAGHDGRPVPGLAFAHQQQGHVRQGRQVAGGADAALAGDHRQHAAVEALGQELDGLGPDPGMGLQQAVDAGGHQGPGLLLGQRLAHAGGLAADQVQLQLGQLPGRDDHGGELAEAGVDAVDRPALVQDPLDDLAVLHHPGQRRGVEGDGLASGDARQGAGIQSGSS